MLKTVAQAVLVYSQHVFLLPHNACDDLLKMMSSFWRGFDNDGRKIHYAYWDRFCVPKQFGRLGFHNSRSKVGNSFR